MKTEAMSTKKRNSLSSVILSGLGLITILFCLPSCQKDDDGVAEEAYLKSAEITDIAVNTVVSERSVYYGPVTVMRNTSSPETITFNLINPDHNCFNDQFEVKIMNGADKKTRVSSAEVYIDGVMIAGPSDFNKNVTVLSKEISGLSGESYMEVKLNSTPGSYLEIWIEGTKTLATPLFTQIGPLCHNSIAPALPPVSENNPAISGKWEPESISTSVPGKTTYTFTPDAGQCAIPVTMEIEIVQNTTPMFSQIGPLLQGLPAPELPMVSENGVSGTWVPDKISTSSTGSFTFVFTPSPGQCALPAEMKIEVTNKGTIADADGNVYNTLRIGEQWWMIENLKTTKYNNGDAIVTTPTPGIDISLEEAPKYQWAYNANEANVANYGRLYTWYAATDIRGVCPTGWHVPTDAEWTKFSDYLIVNGLGFEGSGPDIAKSIAIKSGWTANGVAGNVGNDQISNNISGFSAVPGGIRLSTGAFSSAGSTSSMWSSTERSLTNVWFRSIQYNQNYMNKGNSSKKHAAAIRCIMD